MAELQQRQPPQQLTDFTDLTNLSSQFRSAVQGLTHEWGFVVVRTAYSANNDEAQWAAALSKLRAYAAPDDPRAEMDPNTFALPVIADSNLLQGANFASVRKAFNRWVEDFTNRDDNDQDDDEWPSDVRTDCCIIVDEPALASLLKAPDFIPGKIPKSQKPWVVVVDAEDPKNVPYNGGGLYLGFTRALAGALNELYDDLASQSLAELTPIREYNGQIPLYDGAVRGSLVDPDPEGGAHGRYKFPQGTPRGAEAARAMLEEIERVVGRAEGSGS